MNSHPRVSVPPFDSVWQNIEASSRDVTNDISWMTSWNAKSRRIMTPVFIGLGLFVVALVLFFTNNGFLGMISLVIAVLVAAPSLLYVLRHANEASGQYSETVVAPMIEALIEELSARAVTGSEAQLEASYDPNGGIPTTVLANSGFIRDPEATQEDYIRGTFGATDFMIADVKWQTSTVELSEEAQQRLERRQAREHKRRERERDRKLREKHGDTWRIQKRLEDRRRNSGSSITDLLPASFVEQVKEKYSHFEETTNRMGPSMVFFVADFHKDFTSRTYLLPREEEYRAIRNFTKQSAEDAGLEPLVLEDPEITKRFQGWTTDQTEARYLMTPELMLAISDAVDRMDSNRIAVSFNGSRMSFAVVMDDDRFSLRFNDHDDAGYQMARDIYHDLVAFISLIEHFNLNTRIWSKA